MQSAERGKKVDTMGKAQLQCVELFDRWTETDSTGLREGLPGGAALLRAARGMGRALPAAWPTEDTGAVTRKCPGAWALAGTQQMQRLAGVPQEDGALGAQLLALEPMEGQMGQSQGRWVRSPWSCPRALCSWMVCSLAKSSRGASVKCPAPRCCRDLNGGGCLPPPRPSTSCGHLLVHAPVSST